MVPYFVIWYPNEILLHLYKWCSLKLKTGFLVISVNIIYTNEAYIWYDTNGKKLHLESHRSAVLF